MAMTPINVTTTVEPEDDFDSSWDDFFWYDYLDEGFEDEDRTDDGLLSNIIVEESTTEDD